jgi:hypothetical protein
MNFFNVTSRKFYNELRNGAAFGSNLTDFTNDLVGNVGETAQVIQVITVFTETLASDFGGVTYTDQGGGVGLLNFTGNWFNEGFSVGTSIDLVWDNGNKTASETVNAISGTQGNNLLITNANITTAGWGTSATRTDLIVTVTSAPDKLKYKYALNQLNANVNNYLSPFDGNEQAYQLTVTGVYQTMSRIGGLVSWDLGTVEAKYNGATSNVFEFEIKHTFKIPYYLDTQISNIQSLVPPNTLTSTNSYKYGFGLFMSETNFQSNRITEDVGYSGAVGYLNENFNGGVNNYAVQNLTYTNNSGTNTLEGTETTIVEFNLKNNVGNWAASQEVIIKHSKLPNGNEYENQIDSFDTIWMVDSLLQLEGAVANASSIITNCLIVINGGDPTLLDVSFSISYSASEQLLITNNNNWLLYLIVGDQTLTPYTADRVSLKIDSQVWSINEDVPGLIQGTELSFVNSWDTTKLGEATNFTGWDGDFIGCAFTFQTKAQDSAEIKSITFRLISYNSSTGDWFEINNTNISVFNGFAATQLTNPLVTTYPYQLVNSDQQNAFNITPNENFNRIIIDSVQPAPATVWQDWSGSLAFKVNWRDYVSASRPNVFYNNLEPANGLNELTSNYSNVSGYDIYGAIDLVVGSSLGADTTYRLLSDPSTILTFNNAGGTGFTAVVNYYDDNNDPTTNLYNNQNVRIEVELTHTLGVLGKLWGEIWIEAENGVNQEWRLSTHKNWTNNSNPLQPTDTLVTGNTTLIEIVSVNNLVTLICQTNNVNIIPNIVDKIRYRLGTF